MVEKLKIAVQFDEDMEGFRTSVPYAVIGRHDRDFLLIDENGNFRWVPIVRCQPHMVASMDEVLFERRLFETTKKYEALLGKKICIKSRETMELPGEQVDESGLVSFCGRLESFESNLLTVVDDSDPPIVAKIIRQQVYSIEEC